MKRSQLLHPGTILGTIVLVAALSGSVYGASTSGTATIGSAQIKNGSIKLADISPKARKALRGLRGPAGTPGVTAAGAAGPQGPQGVAGTATAFATVTAAGALVESRSKNLTVTKLVGVGLYCVQPTAASGIAPPARPAIVGPTRGDGLALAQTAQVLTTSQVGCDVATGWPVVTHLFSNATSTFTQTDIGFMVVIP